MTYRLQIACMPLFVGLGACNGFATAGLDALIDDEESYVGFPGTRLAEGRFVALEHVSSTALGTTELARRADGELVVAPLAGDAPCTLSGVAEYQPSWRFGGASDPDDNGFLAVVAGADAEGYGELSLVDLRCAALGAPLARARPLPANAGSPGNRVLAATADGGLSALVLGYSAWTQVSSSASSVIVAAFGVWSIEEGQVVGRDQDLIEVFRGGTAVTELVSWAVTGKLYAVDTDGLRSLAPGSAAWNDPLAADACAVAVAWPWGDALGVLAPCAEGRLQLLDTSEELTEIGLGATTPPAVARLGAGAELVAYVTAETVPGTGLGDEPVGTLYSGRVGGTLHEVGADAPLASIALGATGETSLGIVDWNGIVGRLVRFDADGAVHEFARGVPGYGPFYDPYALTDYDGQSGTLVRLGEDGPVEVLGTRVAPTRFTAFDVEAFVADYDGEVGTLRLVGPGFGAVAVVSGVRPEDYALVSWATVVAVYLRDVDLATGRGTFGVYFPETRDSFEVPNVTAWDVVGWPDTGLVYAVDDGARSGVWYAKAR